jgi:anion-transporting  ArsA/GET3 family ATPase
VLKRLLGQRTIEDIAEFFAGFQSLWAGFRDRSLAAREMLRSPDTHFVLVTTPAPGSRADALAFLDVLQKDSMPFAGFLVNRCARPAAAPAAWPSAPEGIDEATWEATRAALQEDLSRRALLVQGQDAAIADLVRHAPAGARVWRIPEADDEVHDLAALRTLGRDLPETNELAGRP